MKESVQVQEKKKGVGKIAKQEVGWSKKTVLTLKQETRLGRRVRV